MRRRFKPVVGLIALVFSLTSCTAGLGSTGPGPGGLDDKTPVTIEMWSFFTDREKGVIDQRLDAFHTQYPWITVNHIGGQSDDTLLQAIRGGKPPDLSLAQNSDGISSFCSTGTFIDLNPRIKSAGASIDGILPATNGYTSYKGKKCALPVLADVYGLYYNKDLFKKAGIKSPPKTWDDLTAATKKLTKRNPDGSIKVAGFVPFLDFFENNVATFTPGWDLDWYTANGQAAMASDSQWSAMLQWQKELVDWYGYDNLQQYVAGLGAEFSNENPFHTGRLAMAVDGEWRTAFIADQAPKLHYGTAPIPNVDPSHYGGGYISGTTVGIPNGSKHTDAAWLLAKYLATDKSNLVALTNELRNVPTTKAALEDPDIRDNKQFNTMLDIAADKNTRSIPGTPAGSAPRELLTQFAQTWQAGNVPVLKTGLTDVADQIDSQILQASGGSTR